MNNHINKEFSFKIGELNVEGMMHGQDYLLTMTGPGCQISGPLLYTKLATALKNTGHPPKDMANSTV